jgi:hypothetical protein
MGNLNVICPPLLAALLFATIDVRARASEGSNTASTIETESPLRLSLLLRGDSTFQEPGETQHSAETSFWMAPAYKLNSNLNLSSLFIITKDLTDEKETKASDFLISLRHRGWQLSKVFRISPAMTTKIPTSKRSSKDEGLVTAVKLGPRLYMDLGPISAFHDIGIYQSFHKYETSLTQKSNAQNSLVNWTNINLSLRQWFALDFTMQYTTAWTYGGNLQSSFEFESALNFELSRLATLALGVTNGGNIYSADGASSNLALYDPDKSTFFTSLSLNI